MSRYRLRDHFLRGLHALLLSLVVMTPGPAVAQDPNSQDPSDSGKLSLMTLLPDLTPTSEYRGELRERTTLFGDAFGKRQDLYERGIALDFGVTQIPQGVVAGGAENVWRYAGVADYFLFADSGRLDLWPGGLFQFHVVTKFGLGVLAQAGNASPVNYGWLLPSAVDQTETFITEYGLWQGLTDWLILLAGRMEWTALADRNRFANNEKDQFLNTSLRNTPLLGAFTALSSHGAALMIQPHPDVAILPFVISANDEDAVYGSPGGLFSEVSMGAELDVSWSWRGMAGSVRPLFGYTTKDFVDLDSSKLVPDIALGITVPKKNGNWLASVSMDQYLFMPKKIERLPKPQTARFDQEPEGIGVFFRASVAPQDRNPWNIFVSGGVGGRGVVPTRKNDRYGVGLYTMLVSRKLSEQPLLGGALSSEWGFEAFYNVAITPWLSVTPDFQWIQSGLPGVDHSMVIALRMQIDF